MNNKVQEQDDAKVADLLGTLVVLNRGNFVLDAGKELTELVESIKANNEKGKINITLELVPSGWRESDGRCNQVDIRPEVNVTKPKKKQGKSIFFLTDDSKLTRDDPDQESLFEEKEPEIAGRSTR